MKKSDFPRRERVPDDGAGHFRRRPHPCLRGHKVDRHADLLAEALETRGRARLEQGLVDAGMDDLTRCPEVAPDQASVFSAQARACLMMGRKIEAQERIEQVTTTPGTSVRSSSSPRPASGRVLLSKRRRPVDRRWLHRGRRRSPVHRRRLS